MEMKHKIIATYILKHSHTLFYVNFIVPNIKTAFDKFVWNFVQT